MKKLQSFELGKLNTRMLAGRNFLVKTPQCEIYLKKMITWISSGRQGAIVHGRPRLGKTSATRWMLSQLPNFVGNFPLVEVPVREQNIATERAFFQHILMCIKHKEAEVGSAGDKRDRFSESLITKARRSPINGAIMFLDEAHILQTHQYTWLLNVANEMDRSGCRLFCLLVGQSSLIDIKNRLINKDMEQIVGRFMLSELEFSGIRTEMELFETLTQYQDTFYPPQTQTLFVEHYIPEAVNAGFQLNSIVPAMWSGFEKLWIGHNLDIKDISIPMQYLTATLIGILNALSRIDKPNLLVNHELINQAIIDSGYQDSLKVLYARLHRLLNK